MNAAVKRPKRYWLFFTGDEKKSESVLYSKSRLMALATYAVVVSTPNVDITSSNCMITNGALRLTLPSAPPICTASEVTAPNVRKKKMTKRM